MKPLPVISLITTFVGFAAPVATQASGVGRPPLPSDEEIAALPDDGGPDWNRLVFEQSPYLLQHAGNPVDWYPWGEEAFARAEAEDKPVFLSIGYSTCHWCHVMEKESFEDEEVAALLNDGFVCVKLDREERPDIDHVYMSITQALGQRGGWPLTVVMTPDRLPFFIGTYFPKHGRLGRQGMMELLPDLLHQWASDRPQVRDTARRNVVRAESRATPARAEPPGEAALRTAFQHLGRRYDRERGGFGNAPKFPIPHNLRFLLRYWNRTKNEEALRMVVHTLDEMRRGGIWDHVGFGFHRYSTDRVWLVPHFEKMLYDQALLATTYAEAFQATRDPAHERTAREILTYVVRDMTSPEGAFYSAEDADSEGAEGKFYLWQPDEVISVLGDADGSLWNTIFDVTPKGNFRDPHTGAKASIPHLSVPLRATAEKRGTTEAALRENLDGSRRRLFDARALRVHPLKDDKILTDWNGLMIAAFATAAKAFDEPEYAEAASRAADWVLANLRDPDGRLLKRSRRGQSGLTATLEDYAFFLWGLVELYETRFEVRYLEEAAALAATMIEHYRDDANGGFFLAASDGDDLPIRPKESYDGAIPSGNSVAALALLKLARMTGNPAFEFEAEGVLEAYSGALRDSPSIHCQMLAALDFVAGPSHEVVIVAGGDRAGALPMLRALQRPFLPNKIVLLKEDGEAGEHLARVAAYTATQYAVDGRATAYVCRNFACLAPTTEIGIMLETLAASP
jgi:uncharacterized protein YyaL (SSP411 family)